MYAIKINKSNLPLLAILNGGVEPSIEAFPTYLIVNPTGKNQIIKESSFKKLDVYKTPVTIEKLKN